MEEKLELYLRTMINHKGSDLHIKSGAIVRVRVDGVLKKLGKDIVTSKMLEELVKEIATADQYMKLKEDTSLDFMYALFNFLLKYKNQ